MKRWLRLAARFYPAAWRDRYGVEFQALLDQTEPRWRDVVDAMNGGLQMRLRRAHPVFMVAAFGLAGALAAVVMAFNAADRFASSATIDVRPAVLSTASDAASAENVMPRLTRAAFTRDFMAGIVQRHNLYHNERERLSTDDLVNRVRGDTSVQLLSRRIVQVSFASSDARQAQLVAGDLIGQLVWANLNVGGGSVVQVIDPPDEPRITVSPRRIAAAGFEGLSGGALVGALIGWLRRRPSQAAS